MDARIDTSAAFGVDLGDAHIIRNAGGNAKDALRSLIISQQLLGTEEVLVIKHTKCGMLGFKSDDLHGIVKEKLGDDAGKEIAGLDFQTFTGLEEAVKDDVEYLNKAKAIPDAVKVSGWIYDVTNGSVKQVV